MADADAEGAALGAEIEVTVETVAGIGVGVGASVEEAAKTMPLEESTCRSRRGKRVGRGVDAEFGTMMNRFAFAFLLVDVVVPLKSTSWFSLVHERLLREKSERMEDALRGTSKRESESAKAGMMVRPIVALLYFLEPSVNVVVVQSVLEPSMLQCAPRKPFEHTHWHPLWLMMLVPPFRHGYAVGHFEKSK